MSHSFGFSPESGTVAPEDGADAAPPVRDNALDAGLPAVDDGAADAASEAPGRRRTAKLLANHQVLCSTRFRNAVEGLAERNGVTLAEILESAMILATPARLEAIADPGEPEPGDLAVTVVPLANGQSRTFRRKPCLKIRGPMGLDPALIRRLLSFALALDNDDEWRLVPVAEVTRPYHQIATLERRIHALVEILRQQYPNVTEEPPRNLRQATALMGFPNEWCIDETAINKRFREMARVFHPDTGLAACAKRMNSLIEARKLLLRFINTSRRASAAS